MSLPYPCSATTLPTGTPWRLTPDLYQRVSETKHESLLGFKRCQVLPKDPEWDFVWQAFYAQKPSLYGIKRVFCIEHERHTQNFENNLLDLDASAKNLLFSPKWPQEAHADLKGKIIKKWHDITEPFYPIALKGKIEEIHKTRVLPLWHGFDNEAKGRSICQIGFVIPGKTDQGGQFTDIGFFGSGIYFSTSAKYAVNVYSKQSGHVLLAWVSMTEPYPVVWNEYQKLSGKGSYQFYNAHYIPVASRNPSDPFEPNYYPAKPSEQAMCDEVVVFQKMQALPRFWVELQIDLPFSPSSHPKTSGELVNFVMAALQNNILENEQEVQKILKERANLLLIFGDQSLLSAGDETFFRNLNALFSAEEKSRKLAKQQLIDATRQETSSLIQETPKQLELIQRLIYQKSYLEAWQNFLLVVPKLFQDHSYQKIPHVLQSLLFSSLGREAPPF